MDYMYEEATNIGIAVLTAVRADPSRATVTEIVGQYADEGDQAVAALLVGVGPTSAHSGFLAILSRASLTTFSTSSRTSGPLSFIVVAEDSPEDFTR